MTSFSGRKLLQKLACFFFLPIGLIVFSSSSFAAGGGLSVPVRLSVMGGYDSFSNSFGEERSNDSISGVGAGADFNVPFMKTHMVGLTGWLGTGKGTAKTVYANHMTLGLYYGYALGRFDFFLGPGITSTTTTVEDGEAAGNQSIQYSSTMGCGMAGTRYYPFGGKKITGGIALTGFYCGTGSYKKKARSMTNVETDEVVSERGSSSGGLISLFIGWDDERTIF